MTDLNKLFGFDEPGGFHLGGLGWCEAGFFPEFEVKVIEDRGEYEVEQDFAIDEFFIGEDISYNQGLLISPGLVKEFLFPYYQQLMNNVKSRQLDKNRHMYFQLDTDGYSDPVIPLYKEIGTAEYLYYLRNDRNLSPSTVNGCNSTLRFFFEFTLEKSLIYRRIPRLKDPIVLPSILTRDEVEAIINVTENIKHKCILMTIYGSGLRLSEVAALKISDIGSKNMRIFVEQGKGKKDRYVLLSQSNLETLREYWKEYKPRYWLFEGREKGSRISTRAIQDAFKKSLKKAGMHKKASVHTVRHAFVTHLLENGASIFYIRQLLGHATIWTTTRYLHVATTDVLKTVSPLDTLLNNANSKKTDNETKSDSKEVQVNARIAECVQRIRTGLPSKS